MGEKTIILYILLGYIALASLITFCAYGIDKSKAKRGAWRISEKFLLSASFLGGALGGLFAMNLFRHKTKHWYFWAVNVIGLIIHIAVALYFGGVLVIKP